MKAKTIISAVLLIFVAVSMISLISRESDDDRIECTSSDNSDICN